MSCKITLCKNELPSVFCPVVYSTDSGIYHLNVIGKEHDMNQLLASFKRGVRFSAKPMYRKTCNIGIKDYDFFVERDNENGYVNVIFQKKKEKDVFYVFDGFDNLISTCRNIYHSGVNTYNLNLENIKTKLFNYIYKETGVPIIEE